MGRVRNRPKLSSELANPNGNRELTGRREVVGRTHKNVKSGSFPSSSCTVKLKQPSYLTRHLKGVVKKTSSGFIPEGIQLKPTPAWRKIKQRDSGKVEELIATGKDTGKSGRIKNKEKIFKKAVGGLEKTEHNPDLKRRIEKKDLTGESGIRKKSKGSRCFKSPEELYNTQIRRKLKHRQVHYTKDHPFRCNECSYSSSKSSNLKQHMRTHTGEKPFRCSQCPYRGSTRSNLNQHLRTHSGEKPFQCCECPYSGSCRGNLNQHMRTHTRETPFNCEYCPAAFRFQSSLRLHRPKHTGERLFQCEICDYSGSQSASFMVHMKGHKEKKKLECSFCPFWSSRTPVINNHEIRDHTRQAMVSSVSRRAINKVKVSRVKLPTTQNVILPILNGPGDLVQRIRRKSRYVKSDHFNFREFKIDLDFVENNFHKCDMKLRVLPEVLIFGGANLRGKQDFKTNVNKLTPNGINAMKEIC